MITITTLLYAASSIATFFNCIPGNEMLGSYEHGQCINIFMNNAVSSAFNCLLDLIILGMPHRIIWTLKLSRRKKISISLLFMAGVL